MKNRIFGQPVDEPAVSVFQTVEEKADESFELVMGSIETVMAATHTDENSALDLLAKAEEAKGINTPNDELINYAITLGNVRNN